MAQFFISDPNTAPEEMLSRLGVWTPSEYEQELRKFDLSEGEIHNRTLQFQCRYEDTKAYCRGLFEFDLVQELEDMDKRAKSTRSKKHKTGKRSSHRGGGALASAVPKEDYMNEKLYVQVNREGWDTLLASGIKDCNNPELYNIQGEKLHGVTLAECIDMQRAREPALKNYHKEVLKAAIECQKEGKVSDTDLRTCVETKTAALNVQFMMTQQIMKAMEQKLEQFTKDNAEFYPTIKKEQDEAIAEVAQQEQTGKGSSESWSRWALKILGNTTVWAIKQIVGAGSSLAFWIVRDPHTAKIALFIVKATMREMCRSMYRYWIKEPPKLMEEKALSRIEQLKEGASKITGVEIDSELGMLALQEGASNFLSGDGFETLWNTSSTLISGVFSGMVGSIPGVGGAINGLTSAISTIAKDSCKFYIEMTMYKRDVMFAGRQVLEILYLVLPIEVYKTEDGGYRLRMNTEKGECGGLVFGLGQKTVRIAADQGQRAIDYAADQAAQAAQAMPGASLFGQQFKFGIEPPPPTQQVKPNQGFYFAPPSFGGGRRYRRLRRKTTLPPRY